MVSDRTRPRSQRAEKNVPHRRELTRGATRIDRDADEQGVVLDERHQEQPADKGRAHARETGGLNKPVPPSAKD